MTERGGELVTRETAQELADASAGQLSAEQAAVMARQLAPQGATPAELQNYVMVANLLGLSHFAGEIAAIRFRTGEPIKPYPTVHGRTKQAADSGAWEGGVGPLFSKTGAECFCARCTTGAPELRPGETCSWTASWLSKDPPPVAKFGVFRRGFRQPLWAICTWAEWAKPTRERKGTWDTMPAHMLGKQAKRVAFAAAFPRETGSRFPDPVDGQVVQGAEPLTPPQLKMLHTLASGQGWDVDERHRQAGLVLGIDVAHFSDLTVLQAGEVIDAWAEPLVDDDVAQEETVSPPEAEAAGEPGVAHPNLDTLPEDLRILLLTLLEGELDEAEDLLVRYCWLKGVRDVGALSDEHLEEMRAGLTSRPPGTEGVVRPTPEEESAGVSRKTTAGAPSAVHQYAPSPPSRGRVHSPDAFPGLRSLPPHVRVALLKHVADERLAENIVTGYARRRKLSSLEALGEDDWPRILALIGMAPNDEPMGAQP